MIKPLPGFVLLKPLEEESKSIGGVYLPETSKEKPSKGKIIDIGKMPKDGDLNSYYALARAETVIYKKWVNETVAHEGEEYLLVKFEDLMGVIE